MRVIVIGSSRERARLVADIERAGIDVVGEAPTFAEADLTVAADAVVFSTGGAIRLDADRLGSRRADREPAFDGEVPEEPLTARELDVLALLAEGLPNKAIAARLDISDQTVKFHVSSICGKLGASNRTAAVRRAVRRGLITL